MSDEVNTIQNGAVPASGCSAGNILSIKNSKVGDFSKANVGSRIKSNFKALGTRYCDAIKGDKKERTMNIGEIFASAFIGVFMSPFLFIEGTVELVKAICGFESSDGRSQKSESNNN